jgi:hypothetical protein
MSISKQVLLVAGAAVVFAATAVAQTPAPAQKKSAAATSMDEGDAIMITPKGTVSKSNSKVSDSSHTAAVAKGAKEIKPGTVIYNQGGKYYMFQDSSNERASQHFQDQFDVDY